MWSVYGLYVDGLPWMNRINVVSKSGAGRKDIPERYNIRRLQNTGFSNNNIYNAIHSKFYEIFIK